jgi:hypothetical protein
LIDAALRRVRSWIVDSPRWLLLRSLPATSLPLTITVGVTILLGVALPTAFALLSGYLISTLPDAIEQGPGSPGSQRMLDAVVALGVTFLALQVVIFARSTAANALGRRFMGDHTRRVMTATLGPTGLARLEDSAYLDEVTRALATNRHDSQLAVIGLVGDTVMKLQGVVGLVIVAYFQWWLAIPLLLALVHSRRHFGPVRRGLVSMRMGKANTLRRANYLVELTLQPEAAKEIRVFGLADWLVERYQDAPARSADGLPRHEIRFEHVTFQYPGERAPVFSDLDLTIAAGRNLAVVGDNGAGKTTLIKLLARLYEPTAGRITVDGIDLADLDIRGWQRRVAAIFQDFVRYELPATDNVGFGAVERRADRAALVEAATGPTPWR